MSVAPTVTAVSAPDLAPVRRTTLPGGAVAAEHAWDRTRTTVVLRGELDAFDAHALVDVLTACVLDGARWVDVDLHGVGFVDLTVLRALRRVDRFVVRIGGRLTLVGVPAPAVPAWSGLV